jgi:hypothetical protein
VRIKLDARNVGEICGHVTRRNPMHAPSERLRVELTEDDEAEYNKAWKINLIVAFAGPEAQRRHDPKSMRSYWLARTRPTSLN